MEIKDFSVKQRQTSYNFSSYEVLLIIKGIRRYSISEICFQKCSGGVRRKKVPPWDILFFGTDSFAMESLKPLCAKLRTGTLISSLGVVSKQGAETEKFAKYEGLPLYKWPLDVSEIEGHYDIGMVVSFGNLIPKSVIDSLPLGCINVHGSLLPRWRGAAPVVHTILAGDVETGVTVMKIHPYKFDVGEIVRQYRISVKPDETALDLEKKLAKLSAQLLMECLRDLPRCLDMAIPQPTDGIIHAPKIVPSMSIVHWATSSAQDIYNLHRALSNVYPIKTYWQGKLVKLKDISPDTEDERPSGDGFEMIPDPKKSALDFLNRSNKTEVKSRPVALNAGLCSFNKKSKLLKVKCADGKSVVVHKLQVAGKSMTGKDFYNGYLTKVSESEWTFKDQ